MKITIEIDDAESVAHDLADLLCWWDGMEFGMRLADFSDRPVAKNGVEAARRLKESMNLELISRKKSPLPAPIADLTKFNTASVHQWLTEFWEKLPPSDKGHILRTIKAKEDL
jgi:hypothetical protein